MTQPESTGHRLVRQDRVGQDVDRFAKPPFANRGNLDGVAGDRGRELVQKGSRAGQPGECLFPGMVSKCGWKENAIGVNKDGVPVGRSSEGTKQAEEGPEVENIDGVETIAQRSDL